MIFLDPDVNDILREGDEEDDDSSSNNDSD